jgi:hypothetical protein
MRNNKRKIRRNTKRNMSKQMDRSTQVHTYNHYDDPIERPLKDQNKLVTVNTSSAIPAGGSCVPILLPIQGIGSNDRIADAMWFKELEFNYFLQYNGTVDIARIIVFQTTGLNPTGIPPAPADVLEQVNVTSTYMLGGQTSFKILHDKNYSINSFDKEITSVKLKLKPAIADIRFIAGTIQTYNGQPWVLFLNASNSNSVTFNRTSTIFF